ncbi:TraB/GumN family protein [Brumimicrobium mesophilum]|uniref:TraB/GumN family protein n=1 Tax=Brumimicrobium mesophilum TaxID=392717 RepID=UPI000D14170E|nr:TraB/GumN family protein [Brumimicrobium mesophilum]
MKRLLTIITSLFFVAQFGIAQEATTSSLLWEITGKKVKSPSYLFGTMHLIPNDDFLFPESLQEKVKESDILVMEIGGLNEQMKAMKLMMLDSGTMFDKFNEEQLDSIFTYSKENLGFEEAQMRMAFGKMKPFVLLQLFIKDAFGENPQSYEMSFEQIAKAEEIEIIGLETIEEQMGFIDNLSDEEQVKMVMDALKDEEDGAESSRELVDIYLSQDVEKIHEFTTSSNMSSPEFEEDFLNNRNQNWIKPIRKIIKKNKAFIAVGAAHLGGPEGVIELLRAQGYTLTPVKL